MLIFAVVIIVTLLFSPLIALYCQERMLLRSTRPYAILSTKELLNIINNDLINIECVEEIDDAGWAHNRIIYKGIYLCPTFFQCGVIFFYARIKIIYIKYKDRIDRNNKTDLLRK